MIEQQDEHQQVDDLQPLPQFGQVQGQKIRLAGLDYSLLPKETAIERKQNLIKQIKLKLGDFSKKMPVDSIISTTSKLTSQNDQLTKNIMNLASIKPTVSQSTFYLFPTQLQFSQQAPQIITRRFGRMQTEALYVHHRHNQIQEFKQLTNLDDRIKLIRRQEQRKAKQMFTEMDSQNDSDDIFGQAQNEEEGGFNFKIGNKLDLGVQDEDIFKGPRYKQVVQQAEEAPKVVDKYDFMHKKRKPNEEEEGYDECYINNGPSLDEMIQFKKDGIQLFGDAKQFVKKEHKYNIHKDYEKIKRIIDEKSKKP